MHWLGLFSVTEIQELGVINIAQLDGIILPGWVNGAHLKPFHE